MKIRFLVSMKTLLALTCLLVATGDVKGEDEKRGDGKTIPSQSGATVAEPVGVEEVSKVVVYYFHGKRRCSTCRKIEAFTREAVEQGFARELEEKRLELQVVDTDLPENAHFMRDFDLYTKSVVVTAERGEERLKWKNLEKIWQLVSRKSRFIKYIRTEIEAFLEES